MEGTAERSRVSVTTELVQDVMVTRKLPRTNPKANKETHKQVCRPKGGKRPKAWRGCSGRRGNRVCEDILERSRE